MSKSKFNKFCYKIPNLCPKNSALEITHFLRQDQRSIQLLKDICPPLSMQWCLLLPQTPNGRTYQTNEINDIQLAILFVVKNDLRFGLLLRQR